MSGRDDRRGFAMRVSTRSGLACHISLAALALATPSTLQAQQAPSTPATDASGQSPEIVVVGKRLQNVRNLAGTGNIMSAQQLANTGAKDAEDIFKLTPGIQFNKGSADGGLLTI